jgi:hypothetical protein
MEGLVGSFAGCNYILREQVASPLEVGHDSSGA